MSETRLTPEEQDWFLDAWSEGADHFLDKLRICMEEDRIERDSLESALKEAREERDRLREHILYAVQSALVKLVGNEQAAANWTPFYVAIMETRRNALTDTEPPIHDVLNEAMPDDYLDRADLDHPVTDTETKEPAS